ncbi:GGDEF domain-containing protein [Hydrogenophaga aquatica]
MPHLDPRTIVFLTGAMGALMAVVLYSLHLGHRSSIRGLKDWAAAPLVIFISTLLLGARGIAPDWLTIVVANLMLFSGGLLMLAGSHRFFDRPLPRWLMPATLLAISVPLVWWGLMAPDYNSRLVLISACMAALHASHFRLVWRHDRRSFAARFLMVVLGATILIMVVRAITALVAPVGNDLFTPSALQSFYIGGYSFSLLMLTISFVLMASERLRQQLHHLISHDTLTGALSRRAIFDQGLIELERCRRTHRPITVMMLDLDHFKLINDRYGHMTGDRVLRDFALRVRDELRKIDLLGRFGGEEFLVILPETDQAQALNVAERILASKSAEADLPRCTVSIGIATRNGAKLEQAALPMLEELISQADAALYRAKAAGRHRAEAALPT